MPKMPIVDLSDDPWAAAQMEQERRLTREMELKAEDERQRRQLRHDTFGKVLYGLGIGGIVLTIAGVVLGLLFMVYSGSRANTEKAVRLQEERTEQVQTCVRLENPLERQHCLLTINTPDYQPQQEESN